MLNVTEDQIKSIGDVLIDPKRPLKERFRALFTLRNIGGKVAIKCIEKGFSDESALLKHELAYCLGQMQDEAALDVLKNVLEDVNQEPMVRHEAGEAIGAIGNINSIEILEKYKNDNTIEVAETCQLALDRIKFFGNKKIDDCKADDNKIDNFTSIDPAPPLEITNINELKSILLDPKKSLFERYRAMFSLRNNQSDQAIEALCEGLKCHGALFKHEIAFVLGQLRDRKSINALVESLKDKNENEMVRHECAEALGSIADDKCVEVLKNYLNDEKRVVKESCEIALDVCEYENSPEFQYANLLCQN